MLIRTFFQNFHIRLSLTEKYVYCHYCVFFCYKILPMKALFVGVYIISSAPFFVALPLAPGKKVAQAAG